MAAFIITGDENVTSFLNIFSVTIPPLITDGLYIACPRLAITAFQLGRLVGGGSSKL